MSKNSARLSTTQFMPMDYGEMKRVAKEGSIPRITVVFSHANHVLHLRQKAPNHCWTLPSDKRAEGETPKNAALRIIAAETGLDLSGDKKVLCPLGIVGSSKNPLSAVFLVSTSTDFDPTKAPAFEDNRYKGAAWLPSSSGYGPMDRDTSDLLRLTKELRQEQQGTQKVIQTDNLPPLITPRYD